MDTKQAGLINRPMCERVNPVDERMAQEMINCYLARGRYLHSEFTVQLLATIGRKLKNTLVRTVMSLGKAIGKLWNLYQFRQCQRAAYRKPI